MNLEDNLERSKFSISSKEVQGINPKPYGAKQLQKVSAVTGHISNSTLWLFDSDNNRLQTMMRLGIKKDGQKHIFDVYSEIVENAYDRQTERLNISGTKISRDNYIKQLISDGYEILGWVDIPEIKAEKVPVY